MKKKFTLENLCCANCAAKMEDAIRKIEGVESASLNFMALKLTVEAPEEKFEAIMDRAVAVCKKIEPDCVIVR